MTTRLMHCGRQRSKHGGPPCQKHDTNSPCFSLRGPCLSTPMYPTTFLDRKEVLQPRELAPSPLKPSFHRGVPMHNTTRGTSVMKTTYGSLIAIASCHNSDHEGLHGQWPLLPWGGRDRGC